MEEQQTQMPLATAQEMQDLLDYLQACYKGDDARVTAALCIGLMGHLREVLFSDSNLTHVDNAVNYLNNTLHSMILEWQQSKEGKTLLH
jgi:hypothetical protein